MYILLNKNNYIIATSNSKIKGAIKMEMPKDFDYNQQGCYKVENGKVVYDDKKAKEREKNTLRDERKIILEAFDIYKTNVIYGIEEETEEEKAEIMNWYNDILDLKIEAFNNIPNKIKRYIGG